MKYRSLSNDRFGSDLKSGHSSILIRTQDWDEFGQLVEKPREFSRSFRRGFQDLRINYEA